MVKEKEMYPMCVFVSIRMQGKKKEKKRFIMKIHHLSLIHI